MDRGYVAACHMHEQRVPLILLGLVALPPLTWATRQSH
jgi:hypothetical protein